MEKAFEPRGIEQKWRAQWEQSGCYAPDGEGEPHTIVIPPPNVTGTLHMGHAFQHAIMDAITRHKRMQGRDALWLPGTDHAGIATQMVVERRLEAEGKSRHDLGREPFLQAIWDWKAQSGGTITEQIRRMGNSVDWSRERFTMDETCSRAVTEAFVRLYNNDLIYRGTRLVNWDPQLGTAISDLEVESAEEDGHLWHFRYPLADGSGHLTVATTRPETMLGDTAVAVHPEDERFAHLVGKQVMLPLAERPIPIVADDFVESEFGSGCVKITPAHDFNDYALGLRHDLPQINILTPDARISDAAPAAYVGLDRFEARDRVVADMEALGLLERIDKHKLMVPRGDRTGAVVEPFLTEQWFVRAKPLADRALAAVEDGRMRFVPGNWINTYRHWLENIQDWCISRQIWWGHRVPAWYTPDGQVLVGRDEQEARAAGGIDASVPLSRDEDVFDTWFSSALWPFSTLGWPETTTDLARHYPGDVLVTGFDIIFFWVARMAMMGLHFMDDVPFRDIYITGLVRDADGAKMSKSKGNVIDPLDLVEGIGADELVAKRTAGMMQPRKAKAIEKMTREAYPEGLQATGVDALRFTFCALASTGRDIRFDPKRAEGYRNFCNKIWNAARFVLMQCETEALPEQGQAVTLSAADRWIVSRLQRVETEVAQHFKDYRFDLIAQTLYHFVWHEYCDWYLELAKPALNGRDVAAQRGTRRTLLLVLEAILRLLHPIMPFITEEIWQRIGPLAGKAGDSIMRQPYPEAQPEKIDPEAEGDIEWLQGFIVGIRNIRGEMNLAPALALPVYLRDAAAGDVERVRRMQASITTLARVEPPLFLEASEEAPQAATALLGDMKLLVPMKGLIDTEAELARLDKRVAKAEKELAGLDQRLANPDFAKAPEHVVQGARDRAEQLREDLAALREQRERVAAIA
ncbi:valine--tRNA ligase [Algiphilus aromaticivorans]|uniref:valine--tRNA ligase n=1 Tax=Algiphilus aromaticivorans TaxID=382454 RepID=UPI0005C17A32|nr:valine--tRNA ligase [Algiphilus aromaticivorans]